MITLPTPEQLVINGLKYFLHTNKDVKVGEPLAKIVNPVDHQLRQPDGICFYVKVNIWWHELPNYYEHRDQTKLVNATENLIDTLIKPYLPEGSAYLPCMRVLTGGRLMVASQILAKLQEQQDDQG